MIETTQTPVSVPLSTQQSIQEPARDTPTATIPQSQQSESQDANATEIPTAAESVPVPDKIIPMARVFSDRAKDLKK